MSTLEAKQRRQTYVQLALAVAVLLLINIIANARFGSTALYGALDLTEEKRFTLTDNTKRQLGEVTEPILFRVLLAGELPPGYERLRTATEALLADFAAENARIEFEFTDPLAGDPELVRQNQESMAEDGIIPVTDFEQSAGQRSVRAVYPYAVAYYGTRQRVIPLIESTLPNISTAQRLNQAESLLEYNFSRAIAALTDNIKPLIGFTLGHGELPPLATADLVSSLREDYQLGPIYLDSFATLPQEIKLLIIAKPTEPFSDFEAFKLDQYVMNGGKILWAIDNVGMDYDSLMRRDRNEVYPVERDLGQLPTLFFKYGFRLDPIFALDLLNTRIPIVTSQSGAGGPEVQLVPFPYHVLSVPQDDHPIVQNLDPIDLRFPTVIDTLDAEPGLRTTVLLRTSDRARRQRLPSPVDLDMQKFNVDLDRFREDGLPLAILTEGVFQSPYANRLSRENARVLSENGLDFRAESVPTAMIVVADGDVLSNVVTGENRVLPLGLNRWDKFQYANKAFMLNAIEYLLDPNGVIGARGKQVKLRLLDRAEVAETTGFWRAINLALPLVLLVVFGGIFAWVRRRRYAR